MWCPCPNHGGLDIDLGQGWAWRLSRRTAPATDQAAPTPPEGIDVNQACPTCSGRGTVILDEGPFGRFSLCPTCQGRQSQQGQPSPREQPPPPEQPPPAEQSPLSGAVPNQPPCPTCNGRGTVTRDQGVLGVSTPCPTCHGRQPRQGRPPQWGQQPQAPKTGGWSSINAGGKAVIILALAIPALLLMVAVLLPPVPTEDPKSAPAAPEQAATAAVGRGPDDYWSQTACRRLDELRVEAARGLLTEDEAFNKLRDIHGDATNSDDPTVARAVESVLRLHTIGGGSSATAGSELTQACQGS